MNKKVLAITVANLSAAMGAGSALAGSVNTANITTFQPGSPAVAAEVNGNFTELATQVDDNDARITALESAGAGGPGAPSAIDCDAGDTIQGAIDAAPGGVPYTLDVAGTCNENVVIGRSQVTLVGAAGATILGDINSPTVEVSGNGVELDGLTIDGGSAAVWVTDSGSAVIKNSDVGGGSTFGAGLVVVKNASVTLKGDENGAGSSVSSGGNTITGGTDIDEGAGIVATAGGLVQFADGTNSVVGGADGIAVECELGGRFIQSDFEQVSALTVTGDLDLLENCVLLVGNGVVNGTISAENNTTVTLEVDEPGMGGVTLNEGLSLRTGSVGSVYGATVNADQVYVSDGSQLVVGDGASFNVSSQFRVDGSSLQVSGGSSVDLGGITMYIGIFGQASVFGGDVTNGTVECTYDFAFTNFATGVGGGPVGASLTDTNPNPETCHF